MTTYSKIVATITQERERDVQRRVGPSNLAGFCPYCLAVQMLDESKEKQDFNLAAWIGTAVHHYLEITETDPTVVREGKVAVGSIEEYGEITGTADRYDTEHRTVVDYKTTTLKKIKTYKNAYMKLPDGRYTFYDNTLVSHYKQAQLYARAFEGVENVGIFYIPRDGLRITQCLYIEFPYSAEVGEKALNDAGLVYEYALAHGADDIDSDPECYNCRYFDRV